MLATLLTTLIAAPGAAGGVAVEVGVVTASPSLLGTGLLLGPQISSELRRGAWIFGARVDIGLVAENDRTWRVKHTELRGLARAGLIETLGRADLSLNLGAGVLLLAESRTRHQIDRLVSSELDGQESAWSVGPLAALEAKVRLYVYEGWAISLWGGPTLAIMEAGLAPGWMAGMSLALTFEPFEL